MSQAERAGVRPIDPRAYACVMAVLRRVFDGYFHTHVSGREHLPAPGTATIVVSNHVSNLDVFAMGHAVAQPGYFVSKVEATRLPLFGRVLLSVGAIPANRDKRDTTVLRQMTAVLAAGHLIGLAPEGTRSPDGTLRAYDPGFIWLALRTGAVVVPAAIHGTHALMPKGARLPRRGDIWVRFGSPMRFENESRPSREQIAALAEAVRRRTLNLLAELEAESGLPNPALVAPA